MFPTNEKGGWEVPAGSEIPADTKIPAFSNIGNYCTLGDGCTLGYCCTLGNGCTLGNYCTLGDGCTLGYCCTLGNGCTLGNSCRLGKGCTLGNSCEIPNPTWLGVKVTSWLTLANVDGTGRQIKILKHAEGVMIEAGCFIGTLEKFAAKSSKRRQTPLRRSYHGGSWRNVRCTKCGLSSNHSPTRVSVYGMA